MKLHIGIVSVILLLIVAGCTTGNVVQDHADHDATEHSGLVIKDHMEHDDEDHGVSHGSMKMGESDHMEGFEEGVKEITVRAFRFGHDPDVIRVKQGDKVRLKIINEDTLHGIMIHEMGIKGNDVAILRTVFLTR